MKCPVCKSELKMIGQKNIQTSADHCCGIESSLEDTFECSDDKCLSHEYDIFWDDTGGLYSSHYYPIDKNIFIDKNNAPFGSFQRQSNIEIWKDDENFRLPKVFGWQLEVKYLYQSNENGDILSKKPSFILWHNHTMYISGIRMLIFGLKSHYSKFHSRTNKEDYQWPPNYFKNDWWRWVVPFVLRIIDNKNFRLTEMEN